VDAATPDTARPAGGSARHRRSRDTAAARIRTFEDAEEELAAHRQEAFDRVIAQVATAAGPKPRPAGPEPDPAGA
jgi:hypothetical protein